MEELAVVAIVTGFWILLNKLVEHRVPLHPAKGVLNLSCRQTSKAKTSQNTKGSIDK